MDIRFLVWGGVIFLGLCILYVFFSVKNSIRKFSRMYFGTDSLLEGFERQELLEEETPRSIAAMTRLELPRIQRDFPEFSWPQWRQRCEALLAERLSEFSEVLIHRTEILRYEKGPGVCRILVQSAVEYRRADGKKEQSRYSMELVYVQDASRAGDGETSLGVSCPNCGAPVTALGEKSCAYCGAALEPVNLRVWTVLGMKKEESNTAPLSIA